MQTLEQTQTALPATELLHSLIAWCYIHERELPYLFYSYSRENHYQPHKAYAYEKVHKLYGHATQNRVEAAILVLLEGGTGCVWLEGGNSWLPGLKVRVIGLEESHYDAQFNFAFDEPGAVWDGDCPCDDHEVYRPCKHKIVAFYLAHAYKELVSK